MKSSKTIPVLQLASEPTSEAGKLTSAFSSQNIQPILHEIKHAIQRLIDTGEGSTIDLQSIPFAPGEVEKIRDHLGSGEVTIQLEALGPSAISETAYSGVWWVEHRNSTDEITALYIDITLMPAIVLPVAEDLTDGLLKLSNYLQEDFDHDA